MQSILSICRLFYQCEYIPLAVYEGSSPAACFPDQLPFAAPPHWVLADLTKRQAAGGDDLVYTFSRSHCAYFLLRLSPTRTVLGGPVSATGYSRTTISALIREYAINKNDRPAFEAFLCHIPAMTSATLAWKANLLRFCLTGKLPDTVTKDQFGQSNALLQKDTLLAEQAQQRYTSHAEESYNNSYELEAMLQRFVRDGDVEGYQAFLAHLPSYNPGKVADDVLRAFKNYGITSITIVSRAAMDAGLPREIAYGLSDSYITNMERMQQMQDVSLLISQAILDYITRVRKHRTEDLPAESGYSRLLRKCINYIHQNVNRNLSTQELADHVNLSRSHLSTTFHHAMGISLSQYIRNVKLEEACSLLTYTGKSVAEISDYLCFSSQSHFQTVFKKKYGQTPLEYRNTHKKE